ncbi:MAG: biotin--[acetyl-CoA-carboxylase] ligase [Bacteroidia bacterium]|nr:biotin--[acetyl-CoA-carboxylase] ligase [Bacteroidia bacterium]
METYNIEFLAEVDSTNAYLRKKAAMHLLPAEYAVSASMQLRGKGQHGKVWDSQPYVNVTTSFIVKNPGKINELSWINSAAAMAIVQALAHYRLTKASIKWPNDVYVGDRKIGGILTDNIVVNGQVATSVVGIGVNVNQLKFGNYAATSLAAVTGVETDITAFLHTLYDCFYAQIIRSKEELLHAVNQRLYKKEENVIFEHEGRTITCTVKCLLKNGNLAIMDGKQWLEIEHHKTKWIK